MDPFSLRVGGNTLQGALHRSVPGAPVVICCHGLFSSMQSDKFLEIARAYTGAGLSVARFDFGGCGGSTGDIADTTVSGRLQDLYAVAEHLAASGELAGGCGIMGSSMGGYVGMLHAARHPVAALSVWSTPCDLLSITGNIPAVDLQKLKKVFFDDARDYVLLPAISMMESVQVIHGSADEIVPDGQAPSLYAALPYPKEFLLLPGADHSISQAASRRSAIDASLAWFKKYLPRP